jgi:hypothetical protein
MSDPLPPLTTTCPNYSEMSLEQLKLEFERLPIKNMPRVQGLLLACFVLAENNEYRHAALRSIRFDLITVHSMLCDLGIIQ